MIPIYLYHKRCTWFYKLFYFFLIFFLFKSGFVSAQTFPKERNHVVLLIDRSAEMQPERDEQIWNDIFQHLNTICFDSINGNRPLLIPNHDYLSIVSFGTNTEHNLHNYITTEDFGFTYKNNFSTKILQDFKNNINRIGWRVYKGGFFRFPYAYPSVAQPFALKFIEENYTGKTFQKTYIIEITDKIQNKSVDSWHELEDLPRTMKNQVSKVIGNFNDNYIINQHKAYSADFKREEDFRDRSGENYYVDVFSLNPKKQIVYDNIITQNPLLQLTRFPDYYAGELNITHLPNTYFKAQSLDIIYTLDDKIIKKDSIIISNEINTYKSKIEVPDENYELNAKINFYLTVQYENDFYSGTLLTGYQNKNLSKQINITFEPKSKVLGCITLGDSLFSFLENFGIKNQSKAVFIVNIIVAISSILLVILLIHKIASHPYKPLYSQFNYEKLNN